MIKQPRRSQVCSRCQQEKELSAFAWRRRGRGQYDTYCRACRAAYGREHYVANRQRYIDQARIVKQKQAHERTRWVLEYFERHPCTDCGERDPVVLEFDHLRDKKFNVASALPERTWTSILEEIEKCEVVCANCHRRRSAGRLGTLRVLLTRTAPSAESG